MRWRRPVHRLRATGPRKASASRRWGKPESSMVPYAVEPLCLNIDAKSPIQSRGDRVAAALPLDQCGESEKQRGAEVGDCGRLHSLGFPGTIPTQSLFQIEVRPSHDRTRFHRRVRHKGLPRLSYDYYKRLSSTALTA